MTRVNSEEVKPRQALLLTVKMAQRGVMSTRENISCSICLGLLKDPVTTSCGHNYCRSCIKNHWDAEDQRRIYSCPQCRETFMPRPDLEENTMLADLVEELKKTGLQAAPADHCYAGAEDFCEEHLQPHFSPAYEKHKLVEPSKKLQENICSRHNEVKMMFCCTDQQSNGYLCPVDQHKGQDTVSAAAERTERQRELQGSPLNIQQRRQHREGDVKLLLKEVEAMLCLGTWTNISETQVDVLLSEPEPRTRAEFIRYSQDITLDPNTANKRMLLSDENRKVTMSEDQRYPDHPERFTDYYYGQVLSKESLTGRCYWEVELSGEASVAVSYKSICRAGGVDECWFGYNKKSWALDCNRDRYAFLYNEIGTTVSGPVSSRVGVYLDHRAGILSFYRVSETMTLLHRVQTTFTEPLHAGFRIYYCDSSSAELCKLK